MSQKSLVSKQQQDESASNFALSQVTTRISNLTKAVRQAVREDKAGKFTEDRQIRYLQFLAKL